MTSIKQKPKIFFCRLFNVCVCVAIIFGGVFYMAGVNDLSVKGFSIQQLRDEMDRYKSEKRDLELEIMAIESFGNIDQKAREMELVAVDNIDYISVRNNVAKK